MSVQLPSARLLILAATHYYTALELVVHNDGQMASGAIPNPTNLLCNKVVTQLSGVTSYCPPGILFTETVMQTPWATPYSPPDILPRLYCASNLVY